MVIIRRETWKDAAMAPSKPTQGSLSFAVCPPAKMNLLYKLFLDPLSDRPGQHLEEKYIVSASEWTVAPDEKAAIEHSFSDCHFAAGGDKPGTEDRLLQLMLCKTEGLCRREGPFGSKRPIEIAYSADSAAEFGLWQAQERPS